MRLAKAPGPSLRAIVNNASAGAQHCSKSEPPSSVRPASVAGRHGRSRDARANWISIVAVALAVAGCFGSSVEPLMPTTVGVVVEVEPLPNRGRTVAYHLETGEVLEIDLASAEILGGPGGPGEGNLLLAGTKSSAQRWLLGLPPNPSVDARPGCFRLVDTGVEIDGSIEMSNGLRLQKAVDFDPGFVTDGRYAVERYAFCLNSGGEVSSYGI